MPRLHPKHFHRNRKIEHFIDRALNPCLKCGSRIIRTGRRFTISCVEGRIVGFRICRACADSLRVSGDDGALAALVANADAHERENTRGMKEAA